MFDNHDGPSVRRFAAGLALLSLTAFAVTAAMLYHVQHEQEIFAELTEHLPKSDLEAARELSGELSLQGGLVVLLGLNIIGTAIALAWVVRGYLSSERTLQDVKVYSTDVLASMDAGVITTDRNGRMTSINPSGLQLVNCDQEHLGRTLESLGKRHALLAEIRDEVATYHHPIRDRDYTVDNQGHRQTLRAGCTLLRNRRGEEIGTVLHVRDVSEKELIEERLRRMERYMGLGSLAAGLQHEIKNPLSALSLHIQLLCERLDATTQDAEVDELLDVLHTEVHRINDVLDGFRNYASTNQIGLTSVDVAILIERLVRLLRPQAEQQSVKLDVQLPAEMVGLIQGDSVGLEQVLLNLALNGMAAMADGGKLTFRLSRQDEFVRIDVRDEGNGIPEEIRSRVFDPYFTTRNNGTGMGLALCDKIVRQHDGSIDFRVLENDASDTHRSVQGTEFTVLLPLSQSA
ncbi:two-component signal transduction [Rhodopirellula islandica]|uniref:histidine kinase n=1 Tax=Rhodopirellula islandica TaxID=595434 RepID=A0A0J1B7S4_RHOIS|nr:ATP-binding protein [Rhodopirellula islandica]KLU02491.1 two-component signal transduction [Rhodopirellula islandica]